MGRTPRSFWGIAFFFLLALSAPSVLRAETAPNEELEKILQKIEARHYRWIAIRADVLLFFAKAGDPSAMCAGELLYQRLDERMFLTCADAQQELLFVFRAFDRRFDLYLPGQNTVYHGSIFDMEDSPDIESHLKARDLYRALKPTAVDPRRTRIERTNSAITSLEVYGRNDSEDQRVRKLYLTPEGDVRGELFYDPKGQPVTEIQRYDFRELRGRAGLYASVIFPKKITIMSPGTRKGSAIFFTRVATQDTIDPLEFILRVPPGTKEVFLDEKDSRFQSPSTLKGEILPARETERSAPSTVRKKSKKPEPPSPSAPQTPKNASEPEPDERSEGKVLSVPSKEKTFELESPSSQKKPAELPMKTVPLPENPDADIVPEGPSSSEPASSNPQTTLDPSVAPSVEMGRS